jgi:hypothetical protein
MGFPSPFGIRDVSAAGLHTDNRTNGVEECMQKLDTKNARIAMLVQNFWDK